MYNKKLMASIVFLGAVFLILSLHLHASNSYFKITNQSHYALTNTYFYDNEIKHIITNDRSEHLPAIIGYPIPRNYRWSPHLLGWLVVYEGTIKLSNPKADSIHYGVGELYESTTSTVTTIGYSIIIKNAKGKITWSTKYLQTSGPIFPPGANDGSGGKIYLKADVVCHWPKQKYDNIEFTFASHPLSSDSISKL